MRFGESTGGGGPAPQGGACCRRRLNCRRVDRQNAARARRRLAPAFGRDGIGLTAAARVAFAAIGIARHAASGLKPRCRKGFGPSRRLFGAYGISVARLSRARSRTLSATFICLRRVTGRHWPFSGADAQLSVWKTMDARYRAAFYSNEIS